MPFQATQKLSVHVEQCMESCILYNFLWSHRNIMEQWWVISQLSRWMFRSNYLSTADHAYEDQWGLWGL